MPLIWGLNNKPEDCGGLARVHVHCMQPRITRVLFMQMLKVDAFKCLKFVFVAIKKRWEDNKHLWIIIVLDNMIRDKFSLEAQENLSAEQKRHLNYTTLSPGPHRVSLLSFII